MVSVDNGKGVRQLPNPFVFFWSGKRDSNPRPSAWEDADFIFEFFGYFCFLIVILLNTLTFLLVAPIFISPCFAYFLFVAIF